MASAAAPDANAPAPQSAGQDWDEPVMPVANHTLLIVGIMLASILQVLDTTIANVAIPQMQSALGANTETITWVLTSYIIASAIAMPITGWLADRIGARRLFILSVAGFIFASMLCGMARNLEEMVLFRAIQGVAGAFIAPLSQSFMLDTTRPSRHAQMMGLWGMGMMIGPILGPILGGWLTDTVSWRWVFYVNLPIGIFAFAILVAGLPRRKRVKRQFDLLGFSLIAITLTSFQLMLDRGAHADWFASGEIWIYAFLCGSGLWVTIIHFITKKDALFDTALFRDRNFSIAMLFMLVLGLIMFANMALFPPLLQGLFGYSVIDTGLTLVPRGIGVMISMQLAAQLVRRGVDARPIVAIGFLICAYSLWLMAQWSLGVDQPAIIWSGVVQGLGMGLAFIPVNVIAFATLPSRLRTDGSSLLNLFRSVGASGGISLMTVLLARNIQISHSNIAEHVTGDMGNVVDVATIDRFQAAGDIALRAIDAEVNRQAAMVAYIDDFYLMMWLSLAAAPLVMLMRRNAPVSELQQPVAGDH